MRRVAPVAGEQLGQFLLDDPGLLLWRAEDMPPEESAPILRFLTQHLTQPVFGCRLRWERDMLVIWDNRLCVHQAYNDYQGYRRELYRTTVRGEKPA